MTAASRMDISADGKSNRRSQGNPPANFSAVGHSGRVGRSNVSAAHAPARGGTGQCRFRPASFDVLLEAESGGVGCMPNEKGRTSMGAKTEALARQFEGKARDAKDTRRKEREER